MARKNKLTRILSICAVALIVALSAVPAMAASDDGFPTLRAYLPMVLEWKALNAADTTYRDYSRDLLSTFLLGEQSNRVYGELIDGTYGSLGSIVSTDETDDGIFEAEFTSSQRVGLYTLRLTNPVFVPLDYDVEPLFNFCLPEDSVAVSWRVAGYEVIRTTNEAYTHIEQQYKPFAYTNNFTAPEGTWCVLELPTAYSPSEGSKGYVITEIRITIADNDDGAVSLGNLQYKTSYMPINDASYIDQITLMNALGFTAQLPSEANADFVSWIGVAVGAFWNFELVPGLTIQGIVYGCLGLGLLIAFLKFFAGG